MNFQVPLNAGNIMISWGTVRFSKRTLLRQYRGCWQVPWKPFDEPFGLFGPKKGRKWRGERLGWSHGMRNGASYGHKTKTLADNVEGSLCVAQEMWFIYPVCTTPKHMLRNKMTTTAWLKQACTSRNKANTRSYGSTCHCRSSNLPTIHVSTIFPSLSWPYTCKFPGRLIHQLL